MWFERKNVTHEEAVKEYERLLALEDRVDDEYDEERIANMVGADDLDVFKEDEKK